MTHIGKTKWSYCLDKMSPKQFYGIKEGDLLVFGKKRDYNNWVFNARMFGSLNVSPSRSTVYLVTEIFGERGTAYVHAHYVGVEGKIGEAVITLQNSDAFEFVNKEKVHELQ